MIYNRKKIWGICTGILYIMLWAAILTGCSYSSEEKTEIRTAVQTLDWYINFSWFSTEWGDNEVSRAITEKTGIDIRFIYTKGNASEKLNALIASETLPDLVTLGYWEPQNNEMIENEQVYSLNELAEKYDPDFFEVLNEDVVNWYQYPDGNLYGYPNSFYSWKDYQQNERMESNINFLVRKDIYTAIGSPDMTTPEGFSNAVKKAVELFPDVDGKPLIPIGADEFTKTGCTSFHLYLQSFLGVPYEKDGKYYDRNTDPEYIRWLKVFRQLRQEGYLLDEVFIDKHQQMKEKLLDGRYFCLLYQSSDIIDAERSLSVKNPESIYIAVEGPRNSNGDNPKLPTGGIDGWTVTYISKNCKDPEAALALLKYLISEEGQQMTYLGVEGSMWEMKDGIPTVYPEVRELLSLDRKRYDKQYGADNTYWMLQNNQLQKKWSLESEPLLQQMQEWTWPYTIYASQYSARFINDQEGLALHNIQQELWGDTLTALLLASDEEAFNQILQEYLLKREENGYKEYTEKMTELYHKNKEKLGINNEG